MYGGLADRMQKEITALAPSSMKVKVCLSSLLVLPSPTCVMRNLDYDAQSKSPPVDGADLAGHIACAYLDSALRKLAFLHFCYQLARSENCRIHPHFRELD